jgi:hypothetical protein
MRNGRNEDVPIFRLTMMVSGIFRSTAKIASS